MNYGKATKKPVEIDWFKWKKGLSAELHGWVTSHKQEFFDHFEVADTLKVKTLEGTSYDVPDGYIIIRGISGEYYPIEPNIFKNSYNVIN